MFRKFISFISTLSLASLLAVIAGTPLPAIEASDDGVVEFEQMMSSIAAAGELSNNDGHRWAFRRKSDGTWEVEGARRETARVTDAGPNRIRIDGFPSNWGANGGFDFSIRKPGKCQLESDHSGHRLRWNC